jgi:hypothetical protein
MVMATMNDPRTDDKHAAALEMLCYLQEQHLGSLTLPTNINWNFNALRITGLASTQGCMMPLPLTSSSVT